MRQKTFSCLVTLSIATIALLLSYPKASAATVDVTVAPNGNLVFSPSSVTISPGDMVRWTWGATFHSTTSGIPGVPNGIWDSGILNQGSTFTHTFNSTGSFLYYCTPHGACCGMLGMVTVASATPSPTPMPTSTPSSTPISTATPPAVADGCFPQLHDSGRMRCACFSHHRRWKHSTWLAVAVFDYDRQFQYRCWRRSAGPQQRKFQYRGWRSSAVTQHQRRTKHRSWNRFARL